MGKLINIYGDCSRDCCLLPSHRYYETPIVQQTDLIHSLFPLSDRQNFGSPREWFLWRGHVMAPFPVPLGITGIIPSLHSSSTPPTPKSVPAYIQPSLMLSSNQSAYYRHQETSTQGHFPFIKATSRQALQPVLLKANNGNQRINHCQDESAETVAETTGRGGAGNVTIHSQSPTPSHGKATGGAGSQGCHILLKVCLPKYLDTRNWLILFIQIDILKQYSAYWFAFIYITPQPPN